MERLQARPTEYKGVRYRSKSEAMFAMFLDGIGYIDIIYEPDFPIEGWKPDFLAYETFEPSGYNALNNLLGNVDKKFSVNWCLPRVAFHYTEYKPSMPTKTYIERIASCCKEFLECIDSNSMYDRDLFSFDICIGGFYSQQGLLSYHDGKFIDEGKFWLSNGEHKKIVAYRFDLEQD